LVLYIKGRKSMTVLENGIRIFGPKTEDETAGRR
jgi:hypothetical protein